MGTNIELILLLIVKKNGALTPVLEQGFTYSQISHFMSLLEQEHLIIFTEGKLSLTKQGEERAVYLQKELATSPKQGWILPETRSKIDSISINDIYLPAIKRKPKV
ncbi:hypothetical protein [Hymenobacter jejuensis]|uniref:ArnR1-like winged helix-turn-helix domain-containing protein n=1 Tax=Hymenobacter jejuensis TaxID=2502781 RepID=A0A5B7ZZT2_9BACT|nr:hypothetical protein [Hymenobacter jejuensis]QDA59993.1 hypothetical protein FHG12_07650 [Hymenobacter jejuensis]